MKKSIIGFIVGILITVVYVLITLGVISNPDSINIINVANIATNLAWIGLGVFLISNYIINRNKEVVSDTGSVVQDSPEDIKFLNYKQNRIFGYVLIIEIIGSISLYILNNYFAGLTLLNISLIFDLLVNIVFVYIVINIFLNKDVTKLLFYTSIVYLVGGVTMYILRDRWLIVVSHIVFCLYFISAIKIPMKRRNYKIVNFVLLPIVFIVLAGVTSFDNREFNDLWKQQGKIEQEFLNITTDISTVYISLIDSDKPEISDVEYIIKNIELRNEKYNEFVLATQKIQDKYSKEHRSVKKIKDLKYLDYILGYYEITNQQVEKVSELMNYYKKINLKNISDAQKSQINSYRRDVEKFNSELRKVELEYKNQ